MCAAAGVSPRLRLSIGGQRDPTSRTQFGIRALFLRILVKDG
jgi:hypothetical protein